MKLYCTLTRSKRDFVPVVPKQASVYVCGPTVYNFAHIGNARPPVVFDVLRRFLEYNGYTVNYVLNFTDVDDRIIDAAAQEDVTYLEISNKYIQEYLTDMEGLNVRTASFNPRVTEEMSEIIEFIRDLVTKGFAYEVDGTVYFRSPKADNYGKLSKKNIEDLEAGARVEINTNKENPSDFVLWKAAKPGEPNWDSPWGLGRPGWHIECSAMARKYIGEVVDIHCGGEDLIFPHHENEIAQSEAAHGHFVNYWLHNGMILIDKQKMSKSKGNFFTVREIVQRFPYEVLRFFILSVHYRSPLNFSDELLEAAAAGLTRIRNCRRSLLEAISRNDAQVGGSSGFIESFLSSLADDLNTANAITAVFGLVSFANLAMRPDAKDGLFFQAYLNDLDFMCDILGIKLNTERQNDSTEIEDLIARRNAAKAAKDFALADQIRNSLTEMGVTIKDTREGTTWHYTQS